MIETLNRAYQTALIADMDSEAKMAILKDLELAMQAAAQGQKEVA